MYFTWKTRPECLVMQFTYQEDSTLSIRHAPFTRHVYLCMK